MSGPSRRNILHGGAAAATLGVLTACAGPDGAGGAGGAPASTPVESSASPSATPARSGARARTLLAHFSRAGENYHYGGRVDLEVGNTAVVAGIITDLAAVDVYEITAADPYPRDYEATVRRNVEEQQAGPARRSPARSPTWQGTTPSCWAAASGTSRRR